MDARLSPTCLAVLALAGCSSSAGDTLHCPDGTEVVADGSAASGHWFAWHRDGAFFVMDLRDDSCRALEGAPEPLRDPIALHEGSVYYATGNLSTQTLVRHDITSGDTRELHDDDGDFGALWDFAFSESHVYVATYGAIVRVPIEGGAFENLMDLPNSVGVTVGEDGRVFAADWNASIWDFSDPTSPTLLVEKPWVMQSLSQVGEALYVNTWASPTKVYALSTTDGSETEVGQATAARAHVADESGIYMASLDGPSGHPAALTHMSFSGATTRLGTFDNNSSTQPTVSLSDDHVFWHLPGSAVRRAPKP